MKRLVTAAIAAIGIHSLLMSVDFDWMKMTGLEKSSTGSVTIILTSVPETKIKPKNEPVTPDPWQRKTEKNVLDAASRIDPAMTPSVPKKEAETIRKPPQKPSIAKTTSEKNPRPAEPENPTVSEQIPPPSPDSAPDESYPRADAPVPPTEGDANTADSRLRSPDRNLSTLPAVIEEAVPEYKKNPPIFYPRRARQRGYEGTVMLEVLVDQNGRVVDLRILSSSGHAILDRSAANAVKTWSFIPAKKGKDTIDMWVQVPVRFKLE